jgi:NAD dependent epimerase/dehydratase family enzyme
VSGVLNGTAPGTITFREFSDAFGRALRRPSWLPVPGFVLRLLYGEMAAAVLLKGQRVVPRRTQELGFTFRYPTIDEALREVEGRPVV